MTEPHLQAKKSLGQNFLVQRSAIDGIVAAALACPAPRILEIGPGPGVLTAGLLADGRPLSPLPGDGVDHCAPGDTSCEVEQLGEA